MVVSSLPVNGTELFYEIEGNGTPLVFLHAGIADRRMWSGQTAAFSSQYQTLWYDMRGYGQSPQPNDQFSHIEDLHALLDGLSIGSAVLVGCSQGGRIALEFAVQYPERVRGLVLSGTSLRGYEFSDAVVQYAEANDAAYAAGDIELATELDMRMWVDGPKRRAEKVDPQFRERARQMAMQVYQTINPDAMEEDFQPAARNRLWKVTAPALVLVGEYDVPDMINIAGMVAFALANAEKVMISGAGHLLPMELPDVFNAQLSTFLAAHAKS